MRLEDQSEVSRFTLEEPEYQALRPLAGELAERLEELGITGAGAGVVRLYRQLGDDLWQATFSLDRIDIEELLRLLDRL